MVEGLCGRFVRAGAEEKSRGIERCTGVLGGKGRA